MIKKNVVLTALIIVGFALVLPGIASADGGTCSAFCNYVEGSDDCQALTLEDNCEDGYLPESSGICELGDGGDGDGQAICQPGSLEGVSCECIDESQSTPPEDPDPGFACNPDFNPEEDNAHYSEELDLCCGVVEQNFACQQQTMTVECSLVSEFVDGGLDYVDCNVTDMAWYGNEGLCDGDLNGQWVQGDIHTGSTCTFTSSFQCWLEFSENACLETEAKQESCDWTLEGFGDEQESVNLGFVDENLVCLQNRQPQGELAQSPIYDFMLIDNDEHSAPWFEWRNASDFPGRVMYVDGVYTVSDGDQWFTCGPESVQQQSYRLNPGDKTNLINTTSDPAFNYNGIGQLMCYNTGDSNTYPFKECCASDECLNENNELLSSETHQFGEEYYTKPSGHIYELLLSNNIISFNGDDIIDGVYRIDANNDMGRSIENTYWYKWQYLEFLILARQDYDGQITATFGPYEYTRDINDYKSAALSEPDNNARSWYKVRIQTSEYRDQNDLVSFEFTALNPQGVAYQLDITHMHLVDRADDDKFIQTPICSASGEWISDINDDQETCESHPVYSWTGTHCCGSNQYNSNEYDELYIDGELICNKGRVQESNSLINPRVLFYEEQTFSCGQSQTIIFSKDGVNAQTNNTDNVTNFLESVGTKYRCGLDGRWTEQFDAQRASILASSLNQAGNKSGNYHLFCGPKQVIGGAFNNEFSSFTNHVCHMVHGSRSLSESNRNLPQTTTGLVMISNSSEEDTYEFDPIFQTLQETYPALDRMNEDEEFCNDQNEGFQLCQPAGAGPYQFHYDNDFGLFVTSTTTGLFDDLSFWDTIFSWWDGLTNAIFGEVNEPQPVELQLDARNVFVSKHNEKTITGFYDEGNNMIRVDYYGVDEFSFNEHLDIYLYHDVNIINNSYSESHGFVEVSTNTLNEQESYEVWKALTSVTRLEGS